MARGGRIDASCLLCDAAVMCCELCFRWLFDARRRAITCTEPIAGSAHRLHTAERQRSSNRGHGVTNATRSRDELNDRIYLLGSSMCVYGVCKE